MLERLVKHNRGYFAIISERHGRAWGELFLNPANPDHLDSNHADITKSSRETVGGVLAEIEAVFGREALPPVVYINQFSQPEGLPPILMERGYNVSQAHYDLMLWEKIPLRLPLRPGITVEKVEVHNRAEVLPILAGEKAWGTPRTIANVFEREYIHPDVTYWLVRKDGVPAATGFMFSQGQLARVDNVRTLPPFRRQGCATALIQHMQQEFLRQGGQGLYLQVSEPIDQSMYFACGFRVIGRVEHLTAIRKHLEE